MFFEAASQTLHSSHSFLDHSHLSSHIDSGSQFDFIANEHTFHHTGLLPENAHEHFPALGQDVPDVSGQLILDGSHVQNGHLPVLDGMSYLPDATEQLHILEQSDSIIGAISDYNHSQGHFSTITDTVSDIYNHPVQSATTIVEGAINMFANAQAANNANVYDSTIAHGGTPDQAMNAVFDNSEWRIDSSG